MPAPFLPTTREEMDALGWDQADVVFVSGDAYVDHPSFAAAILGRHLEAHGFRVAILPQPDWRSADPWRALGRPRLFYAVSAGNMDSMINHYTANKKRRNDDAYSPGGRIGLRPDRPTPIYAQRCREAFSGVPVVIGGVEASLRRIAHYDYWSDTVRPSMLVPSKADLLVYGMGERPIVEIARRLDAGEPITALRDLRGVAYLLGRTESLPDHRFEDAACDQRTIELPSFEAVTADNDAFVRMTALHHHETNPLNARRVTQAHGDRLMVQNPPSLPMSEAEMDAAYDLPYTRRQHPRYEDPVPAHTMIKDSVTIMRGCFGGCTFCSITMHQGRIIQSRSERSILEEVHHIAEDPEFKGTISDIGGPTANMYKMRCTRPEIEAKCRRLSCIHPKICPLLGTDHKPTVDLLDKARATPGVRRVHVASGIRMDLANRSPEYVDTLVRHHVGGHLKVAPEHTSDTVLSAMKKPPQAEFEAFEENFAEASRAAGKKQYLVPYFIASHPGSTTDEMIELAVFLKARGYRPRQVQDFIPAPMDIATCMYHTGRDPFSGTHVETPRRLRDRQVQRALLQYFRPENWFTVRRALLDRGRADLIGDGPTCLIPARAPAEAIAARRRNAAEDAAPVHAEDAGTSPTVGYRPGRKGARRRRRRPGDGSSR
ncbi:MAG: YgiQ family radical SAM protein [Planctomycetes bacterium]|nr:YgiQ family radical SAM protein [Planctomycetota bacterium]MCB9824266.1 YgiQ family radical SAM protein [Planctomycetota bacterium]MCB9828497.1 YgiQ family radical SAM protein [Planctomycetota bacterium]MCB9900264.1 YgiQ family radical SAM protein [Planctomycetota bacterium]